MKLDELTREPDYKQLYFKLLGHTKAIRKNQDIVGHIFLDLSEYPPNASRAMEAFDELGHDYQTPIFSVSTTIGGVWETWQRDAIRYGRLDATNSYAVWERRSLDYQIE